MDWLENIPHPERQCLLFFMQDGLFNKKNDHDLALLAKVSDDTLKAFANAFSSSLNIPPKVMRKREQALGVIEACMRYQNAQWTPEAPEQVVIINPTSPFQDDIDNSAVRARGGAKDGLGDSKNISLQTVRLYRYIAGWKALTNFLLSENFAIISNNRAVHLLVTRIIDEEKASYRKLYPNAAEAKVDDYIAKEFVAVTTPKMRNDYCYASLAGKEFLPRLSKKNEWIDLSPKAQDALRREIAAHGCSQRGTWSNVTRRVGWITLSRLCTNNLSCNDLVDFLDQKRKEKISGYMCTGDDPTGTKAEQWVQDNYLWQQRIGNQTRRVLSPAAQKDMAEYLDETHPGWQNLKGYRALAQQISNGLTR